MTHGGAALPPSPSPLLHRPATPSELLTHTLAHLRHPTTLIVCWPRQQFVEALVQDICQQQQQQQQPRAKPGGRQAGGDGSEDEDVHAGDGNDGDGDGGGGTSQQLPQPVIPAHQLLSATLLQVSISRHIRMLFVPSVVHLRAHLAAPPASPVSLSSSTLPPGQPPRSKITAPPDNGAGAHAASPNSRTPTRQPRPQQHRQAPLLLIYGLFELHRDGTDWSAQGLNASLAVLVECAARSGLVPALVEPRRMERDDSDVDGGVQGGGGRGSSAELLAALAEPIPVLSGSERRRDGSWSGRTVPVRRVLARWFDLPSSPTG